MNNTELEKKYVIKELENVKDEIDDIWKNLNTNNIKRLNEIWKDDISKDYIDKFNIIEKIINDIVSNLEKLKKDIEKSLEIQKKDDQ